MTEIDLTPVTRLEYDIDAILNDHAVAEPITRIELILADIVAGNTTTVEPVTRIETYLAIISGADYPVPKPVTRIETFLAIIAGEDYEEPEAVTRLEGLLAEWVEKGSGIWKTVTGALIRITDALASPMQKCEVTLEPIQDLHGQDAPYPAGGGQNILDPNLKFTSGTYYGLSFTASNNGYSFSYSGTATGSGNIVTNAINSADAVILPAGTYITTAGTASIYSATGSWIRNQYSNTPFTMDQPFFIRNFYLEIISGRTYNITGFITLAKGSTALTEWSPFANICPITGWTGANVNRTGKNLYMGTKSTDRAVIYGGKNNHNIVVDEDYSFKAGTYRFSCTVKDMVSPPSLFVSQKVGGVWTSPINKGQVTTFTFTVPENCEHYEIWGYGGNFNGFENIQIELGSAAATEYEEPSGTTLSVTFPDTVYGGEYEFVSGKCNSSYVSGTKKLSEFTVVETGTNTKHYRYFGNFYGDKLPYSNDNYNYCNIAPNVYGSADAAHFYPSLSNGRIELWLPIDVSTDTDIQICSRITDPTETQLTPQEISTLRGENNVWSNSNADTTIIYKAQSE